jgi:predicted nucleic acid-binding protein
VFDDNSPRASENLKHITLPLVLTPLLETEIANAFQLRIFRRESDENQIRTSFELFAKDLRAGVFEPKPFTTEIFRLALQMSGRSTPTFGTRTLDLLHVASAVVLQSEKFYTFDRKQAELARSEGLVVRGH